LNTVFLNVTNECNNNCFYCLNKAANLSVDASISMPQLTLANYQKLIEDLSILKTETIILTGGEPLIYPDIENIISTSAKFGIYTLLLTNGEAATREKLLMLKNAGLSRITLSLSKLLNETSSDFKVNIEKYLKISEDIVSVFGSLTTVFLLTSKNYNSVNEIYIKFCDNENRHFIIQPLHIEEKSKELSDYSLKNISADAWKKIKKQLTDWMVTNNTYSYIQLIYDYYVRNEMQSVSCFMGSDSLVISADGSVYPCFHRRDLFLGNIQKNTMRDIVINSMRKSNSLIDAECISSKCLSLFIYYV